MGKFFRAAIWAVPLLAIVACHGGGLIGVNGGLAFSSPDQPNAVQLLDAGFVQIDFGKVASNSTKTLTLAAVSLGSAGVTLGALATLQPDTEFSLPFVPGTEVEPSPPSQITVGFSPTSIGSKSAVYSLAYTSPTSGAVTVRLIGEGVLRGIDVTPNPVDFGNVELNQVQPVPLTLTNLTETSATLLLSNLAGTNSTEFGLGALSNTTLAPSASTILSTTFGPLVAGPASASFTVSGAFGDGTAILPINVNLSGTGVQSLLQIAPLDFGYVAPEHTLVKSALVKNAGSFTTLHLIAPAPHITAGSSVFALAPSRPALPLAIAPGQTAQIPVAFTPTSLGSYQGTLAVASDDPGSPAPVIELKGHGGGPQILCLSPLVFGPVPLGHSSSQKTVCLNEGTGIPGDPDAGLVIAQSGLSTDNAAFTASWILPDAGLAGSDFSASLAPGESAGIEVTFRPTDAGVALGRLLVHSNDPGDPDAGVALSGDGLVPGVCTITLVPPQLSFGEVPSGDTGILPFEIENTGQNLCIITGIRLDPQTDPAFSLSGGNSGYQLLSFAGNPDNPQSLPTSVTVDVQFAPTVAESAATGTVDVSFSNAAPALQTVPLAATCAAACLTIAPPSYDFGLIGFKPSSGQICLPDQKAFVAANACDVPVTITDLEINSGVAPTPQFSLGSDLQLPLVVAPGGSAYFQASFTPTGIGPELGAITVSTDELPAAPFLVTLQGDAETKGSRTDTFTAVAPSKQLDLVWLLDEDDDRGAVDGIAGVLPQLIGDLNAAKIDYQMAVTSTDVCDAGSSDQGFFEPCDHCLSQAASSPTIITPSTPDGATVLIDLLKQFDVPPQVALCDKVGGDEHFFDSIAAIFSPALLAGHNSGFIRPTADLVILVVNGDEEDDRGGTPIAGTSYPTTLDQVTQLVQGLKSDPTAVSVSYINQGATSDMTPRMAALVQATGGKEFDSVAVGLNTALVSLFPFGEDSWFFYLSAIPDGPLEVDIAGIPASSSSWFYDPGSNAVIFAGSPPSAGSTITVTYDVECP